MSVTSSRALVDEKHDERDFRMIVAYGVGQWLASIMVFPVRGGELMRPRWPFGRTGREDRARAGHQVLVVSILRRPWG